MSKHLAGEQGGYARFDGMTWPTPSEDFVHKLKYGGDLTGADRHYAADVVLAYDALVYQRTIKGRNLLIRDIRRYDGRTEAP